MPIALGPDVRLVRGVLRRSWLSVLEDCPGLDSRRRALQQVPQYQARKPAAAEVQARMPTPKAAAIKKCLPKRRTR